jgi:hypothetical protein
MKYGNNPSVRDQSVEDFNFITSDHTPMSLVAIVHFYGTGNAATVIRPCPALYPSYAKHYSVTPFYTYGLLLARIRSSRPGNESDVQLS